MARTETQHKHFIRERKHIKQTGRQDLLDSADLYWAQYLYNVIDGPELRRILRQLRKEAGDAK